MTALKDDYNFDVYYREYCDVCGQKQLWVLAFNHYDNPNDITFICKTCAAEIHNKVKEYGGKA